MRKFRKKPVVIEAMQWNGTNVAELRRFFGAFANWTFHDGDYVEIGTLEGEMFANPGDWIIKGVKGEFYPCKPDIFEEIYEAVTDGSLQTAQASQTNTTPEAK